MHSLPARMLAAPATAVAVNLGGLYALYLTGLYQATKNNDTLHAAVHLHMFLTGCLLSWVLIGVDPIQRRPSTPVRLAALVTAAAGHDTVAKLLYAWNLPTGGGPLAARHAGAELLYYGGTVIDVALAVIMMAQWYLASDRDLTRARRRAATPWAPQASRRTGRGLGAS
jgi:putative membrane protein